MWQAGCDSGALLARRHARDKISESPEPTAGTAVLRRPNARHHPCFVFRSESTMPIAAHCPQCRARFSLADELAGKVVRCSACSETFRVPLPPTPTPAPAAPVMAVLVDEPAAPAPHQAVRARPGSIPRPLSSRQSARPAPALHQPASVFPLREVLIITGTVLGIILSTWVIGAIIVALRSGPEPAPIAGDPMPNNFNPNPIKQEFLNPPPVNPPLAGQVLDAAAVVREFQMNEAASNAKYLGKVLTLRGPVAARKGNQVAIETGLPSVWNQAKPGDTDMVLVSFRNPAEAAQANGVITVRGTCLGFDFKKDLQLTGSELVR